VGERKIGWDIKIIILHQNKNILQYPFSIRYYITSFYFTILFFKRFMFWYLWNWRHWNCGFIERWGFFSIKCAVTTLANNHKKNYSKSGHRSTIFSTNVLCMSHSGFLVFCQVKKICQNKTDGWTPFLLVLKNISTCCVLCVHVFQLQFLIQ
jgi:isoprenylcysteine carboxyl methyltransferase (ICMT) family protein YpbQ